MTNNTPLVNQYFQDNLQSDIFDEISSKINTDGSFYDGSDSCNDLSTFIKKESTDMVETIKAEKELKPTSKDVSEPVICRLFASEDEVISEENKSSDKVFFDMISNTKSSDAPDIQNSLPISNTVSSNLFTSDNFANNGLFITPSGTDLDNDLISDDLFIKGGNCHVTCNSVEMDRRRDAWIPSSCTRQALITATTSSAGGYIPDRGLLTMPGVVLQEDMVDSVYQVVNHYLGEAEALQRKVLTLNDVTHDEKGLQELIQAECYRSAVNLTSRLLTMYGQGVGRAGYPSKHTLYSVQLWFTRIALLVKLRSWSVAWAEAEAWWDLDRPDLYFQFYSEIYGGRPGTLVPFSFRLLLAELPQFVHKSQEALQRLFSVLSTVKKILKNLDSGLSEDGSHIELSDNDRQESKMLWTTREIRVLYSIINVAFQQKDYKLTIDVLKRVINHSYYEHNIQLKRILISSLGRVYLQLGDMSMAKYYFKESSTLKPAKCDGEVNEFDFQESVDLGLLSVAENDFNNGLEFFTKASKRNPSNIMVINNMAICLLYQGMQKDAVKLLENAIEVNPTRSLHESLLLNVCTLYELESSQSIENKYKMLKLISTYKGDSISLNCLKLQIRD